ncbi:MAG: putative transport protein [Acidimicrobiales bacterium]|nr:putative transport protein [Acidimicrobiales bacterium]
MAEAMTDEIAEARARDARRWFALAIALTATVIVVLDNTVLSVAIPTIMQEFHTTLPALQWVITGYALTFATFLIIGGRLGDLYGHRRVFIVGAALFGVGSLLASLSWNVASLVVGEAIIEGLGASLMLPATLAILSTTFSGKERATAFAAWGAVAGSAAGLGPVLGGWLTSDYSWRWSFRINVIIAPLAIIGTLLAIAPQAKRKTREPLDLPGAALVAVGMFLLVFALSEGGSYGWITPIHDVTILGAHLWPQTQPISIIPIVLAAAAAVLTAFYRVERKREREDRRPLFEFGLLHHRTFRYGLLTTVVLAMGQLGLGYALALFLQEGKHLTALHNGLWVLPMGLSILLTAPIGGRLAQRFGTPAVVRLGLAIQATGLLWIALHVGPDLTFLRLMPGLIGYGTGVGWASAQLTNLVLSDVPTEKSGVASGTNTTVRQVGSALGIAVIGTLVTTQTVSHAVREVDHSATLPPGVRSQAAAQIHAASTGYRPAPGTTSRAAAELGQIMTRSIGSGTRDALIFAACVVLVGLCVSMLLPKDSASDAPRQPGGPHDRTADLAEELAEELAGFVAIDPEAAISHAPAVTSRRRVAARSRGGPGSGHQPLLGRARHRRASPG